MKLSQRLERNFAWIAIPNLTLYIIIGQVMVWLLQNLANYPMDAIALVPGLVIRGEVWRLFTFIFFPPQTHFIFLVFAWLILFLTGTALEQFWGSLKYTGYVLLGWFLTVLATIAGIFVYPGVMIPNLFITASIFLAFAYVNPNYEFMIFFVLPVKVKWLAVFTLALFGYQFLTGHLIIKIVVLAGVGNYLIFFGRDMIQSLKGAQRRREHRQRYESQKVSAEEAFHTCSVCGVTDIDEPDMQFVYSDGKGFCERCIRAASTSSTDSDPESR
ncbi:MAG: hypothetical protein ABQ298_08115 [Puniceicoccaceae bacterium]